MTPCRQVMDAFRIATLNIWNRFGPWEERLVAIRHHVKALQPDVLGLQEVLRSSQGDALDQAVCIAEGLGYEMAFGVATDEHGFPIGNAVLSRWPILESSVLPLPNEGTRERRSLLCTKIQSPFGVLPFFVTHLNWKLNEGHVRLAQVRAVVARIAAMESAADQPAVLVGDMNAEPDADEMRYMRGLTGFGGPCVRFSDAFSVAGDGTPGYTFCRRNPFAAMVHEPNRRIDYIFSKGPDDRYRGEVLDARVCFDTPVAGVFASDHFGVIATIRA